MLRDRCCRGVVEELHGYIAAAGMHPVVVGHSLGGLLALMLADKYPGDVRKMVIVDTLPFYAVLFNPDATVERRRSRMVDVMRKQMMAVPADQYAAMQGAMAAAAGEGSCGTEAGGGELWVRATGRWWWRRWRRICRRICARRWRRFRRSDADVV